MKIFFSLTLLKQSDEDEQQDDQTKSIPTNQRRRKKTKANTKKKTKTSQTKTKKKKKTKPKKHLRKRKKSEESLSPIRKRAKQDPLQGWEIRWVQFIVVGRYVGINNTQLKAKIGECGGRICSSLSDLDKEEFYVWIKGSLKQTKLTKALTTRANKYKYVTINYEQFLAKVEMSRSGGGESAKQDPEPMDQDEDEEEEETDQDLYSGPDCPSQGPNVTTRAAKRRLNGNQ